MSIATRQHVCDRLVFQRDSQRADLMDPNLTHTELIALLLGLLDAGHYLEITAVRSDHHDDSALGEHSHANGWCVDCWPTWREENGTYIDAQTSAFRAFLEDVSDSPWLYQVGLAGTADTPDNQSAAGTMAFSDGGADHVHLGAQ